MAYSDFLSIEPAGAVSLIGIVVISYAVVYIFLEYRRLQHVPGPWYVGVTPAWLAYHTLRGKLYLDAQELFRKYGSVVKVAPNVVVIDDPDLYRIMAAPRSPFLRGCWFEGMKLRPNVDNILSTTDEKKHAELRTKVMPGYSGKEVATLESDIDSQVIALLDNIQREYIAKNMSFDFAKLTTYFTLDVLSQIAFGSVLGFLKNNRDMFSYHKMTEDVFPILDLACNMPILQKLLYSRPVQALIAPKPSDKNGLGVIVGTAHTAVADKFDSGPDDKRNDMLASFIRHGLTQTECETESVLQVMGGSDSTATALRMIFWYIMHSPPVYVKLMQEIQRACDSGKITQPIISSAEAEALPYLQACIREGLRIFMPLHGLLSRVSPPGGYTWNGVYIPAGTQIGIETYSMIRRKDIFGLDADIFQPERFIEGPSETIRELKRVQELCFGYGRQSCLGKGIAMMELGKVIFELFRNYNFTVVHPLERVETRSHGVVRQKGMYVRAWSRQAD